MYPLSSLFFFLLFPLCHPAEPSVSLLMSLVLKRASHLGDHVISKKPFRHLDSCIVWVWREATKVCRQWGTLASCCCEQSKGWSCCPWVKMWFCGFTCIFQSEGLLESARKNCTETVVWELFVVRGNEVLTLGRRSAALLC